VIRNRERKRHRAYVKKRKPKEDRKQHTKKYIIKRRYKTICEDQKRQKSKGKKEEKKEEWSFS
jgi:hypothetical protein